MGLTPRAPEPIPGALARSGPFLSTFPAEPLRRDAMLLEGIPPQELNMNRKTQHQVFRVLASLQPGLPFRDLIAIRRDLAAFLARQMA